MKRVPYILLGMLVGIALTISAGAYAANSGLIGKKITAEVPIVLDGKKISEKGSVAGGTTLLPVRSLAGLFGADVKYTDGTVYLTSTEVGGAAVPEATTSPTAANQLTEEELKKKIADLDSRIEMALLTYNETQEVIDRMSTDPNAEKEVERLQGFNDQTKASIEELQKEKADLEAQLKALQQ
ncbi:hypothetical protein [Cohnella sp. AR92]|uniref:hypothetical protein n=1 Tax=Cohnella sp. AR92 TaxID=648716 RepID=UPI000F8D1DB8|nr:hypothetical protein [Cohnella sp. AR92]RUS41842.1 hypothetical protein ELR57_27730 [Cohnella sp. AR92]